MNEIFVFDTNSLISAFLLPESISRQALEIATLQGSLALSEITFEEFIEVLFRKKFDKYFSVEVRWKIVEKVTVNTKMFFPAEIITDCRDLKDNKFLELAVCANASCIITGDNDLLILNPYRTIPIINASSFVKYFSA